jgi:serine protease Do
MDMDRQRLRLWMPAGARLAVMALIVLLAGVLIGWNLSGSSVDAAGTAAPAVQATRAPAPQGRAGVHAADSYADLVAQVAPAVVTIRSERVVRQAASPLSGDDFFQQFFGTQGRRMRPPQPREEGALGSGVIVSPDGYILTNDHVVDGASQIRVELTDRRSFVAKVIGTDKPSDLAVLKIEATGLHSLPLGDTRNVRVGDVVLAIGNPLGVGQTVTMGIISAKGRATGLSDGSFEDFLQTDAPINQGNSGGALVDTRGELVGINSQILTPTGGSIGIGFAIPSDMADNVMQQLIKTGTVRRAKMGVTVQGVTSELAESLGLKDVRGAIVSGVENNSPAGRAGIQRGDVILTFNGEPVSDSNSLRNRVASSRPGSTAAVQILRNGREETKQVTLAELSAQRNASNEREDQGNGGRFGMTVSPLTPDAASQLGVRAKAGLVVEDVAPASLASEAGIRSGDVIVEVNHHPVNNISQFQEAVKSNAGRPALLLVNRQGNDLFLALGGNRKG